MTVDLNQPATLRDLEKLRKDFGQTADQLGSAIGGLGKRLDAVVAELRARADTVTKTADNVTELSRGLSHVTEQVGILRDNVETTHKHFGQQLATALGASREPETA
jgi:ABC-type transporter Mla subunit MlaD